MRSLAREVVFKYLFSTLFTTPNGDLFNALKKEENLSEEDMAFADKLYDCVYQKKDEYLELIDKFSVGFKVNRLFNADKCALLLGIAELKNFDTPVPVAIDEAVKLSAKYSTEKSTDFVNGILARVVREN